MLFTFYWSPRGTVKRVSVLLVGLLFACFANFFVRSGRELDRVLLHIVNDDRYAVELLGYPIEPAPYWHSKEQTRSVRYDATLGWHTSYMLRVYGPKGPGILFVDTTNYFFKENRFNEIILDKDGTELIITVRGQEKEAV